MGLLAGGAPVDNAGVALVVGGLGGPAEGGGGGGTDTDTHALIR